MIRDTAAQDTPLARSSTTRVWKGAALVCVLGTLAIGGYAARGWLAAERSVDGSRVRIAAVHRGTLVRDIVADGRVAAANSPTLFAKASGTIELRVDAGDAVRKGEKVALIDSPELESRLTQERATRDQLQAELDRFRLRVEQASAKAKSLVDQANIDRKTALRERNQARVSFAEGILPEIDLLRANDALAKADVALAHARENLTLEKKGLEFERRSTALQLERQREVARDLERQVGELAIKSPVDGIVGQLITSQRATVGRNDPLLTVVDLTALELEIKIPESLARELALGMATDVTIRGEVVDGKIRSVSPQVISGEVAARIEFVGAPPEGLRQNQRLSARIVIEEKPDVLMVDRGPSLEAGGASAYVVADGLAEKRAVQLGKAGLRKIEILSGAAEGEELVISGADNFEKSKRVRIADAR